MIDRHQIEQQAAADRLAVGQMTPPYRPSQVLKALYGVATNFGVVRQNQGAVLRASGMNPHITVSQHVGSSEGRRLAAHELGHLALGHVKVELFAAPAGSWGTILPKAKESEADLYSLAFTMPAEELQTLTDANPTSLQHLMIMYDVPKRSVKQRVSDLNIQRQTYDGQNHTSYVRWGWWPEMRRPQYLADLMTRQGRHHGQGALCEARGCRRNAFAVHHLRYADGHETDADLEALCQDCHYDKHISLGRIRRAKESV